MPKNLRIVTIVTVPNLENITRLLHEADSGRAGAIDELMRLVYEDLERMAASHLRKQFGERAGQVTLETGRACE